MGTTESLTIICDRPSGEARLEAVLSLPPVGNPVAGVVACHPHPSGGGEMCVGMLETMDRRMVAAGLGILRFNFAGVGGSTGAFTEGFQEALDVAAAFEYLRSRPEIDPERVSLTGWSFGAWMALTAVADGLPAHKCVAIAPPLALYDWQEAAARLASSPVERHYILGSNDQFCPLSFLESFTGRISEQDAHNVMVLPATDHYMFGREDMVSELVIEFVEQ